MSDNQNIADLIEHKDQTGGQQKKQKNALKEVNRRFEEREAAKQAAALGYEYVNLEGFPIDTEALGLVKEEESKKSLCLPFHHESGIVRLACVNPASEKVKEVRQSIEAQKYKVRLFMTTNSSFEEAHKHYQYVVRPKQLKASTIKIGAEELQEGAEKFTQIERLPVHKQAAIEASELLVDLISAGIDAGASDIHLEAGEEKTKIRFRIDGVLQDQALIYSKTYHKILSRLKVLTLMKLNITNQPQDGSFGIMVEGKPVDFRISVLPGIYGENTVMRILSQAKPPDLEELGLARQTKSLLSESMDKSSGIILTTGPTGSGKTTTLYAVLRSLKKPGVKIITVEDPVEYKIEGISQTPIDKRAGLSFGQALRSILRQDPDVVMVGEIRDKETANVATQAALTGHVVLSTLHTNDAVGIIPRLLDLQVKPMLIVGSLRLGMAQRLVRRICENCKQIEQEPDPKLLSRAKTSLEAIPKSAEVTVPKELHFYRGKGCGQCNQTGYKGRVGIYEAFGITPELEKLILRQAPVSSLREQVISDGMLTMLQDGLLKALQGTTDLYEVFRVTD